MKRAARGASLLIGFLVTVATALPWLRATAWWIRACDFPRPQILVAGLLALACAFWLWPWRRWPFVIVWLVVAACVLYQGWRILPYTPLAPYEALPAKSAPPDRTISLLVANVYMENRNARGLLDLVERWDPDLLLVLEPDAWWEEQLSVLTSSHPYQVRRPLPNTYGILLYSKLELLDATVEELVEADIPSIHARLELPYGIPFDLHCIHPRPPAPQHAEESLERDAELLVVARRVQQSAAPAIVTGDLNDVAWSPTTRLMQQISGLLDPRKGRGMFNTFHAQIPLLRWPLDHIFHTAHFKVSRLERLPGFGSDHFPIFGEFVFDGTGIVEQRRPMPTVEDADQAEETIQEAREKEAREQEEQEP